METNIKKNKDSQVNLTVTLSADDLKDYVRKTEDKLSRDLEVDGFRKGKVSRDLLRKHIPGAAVLQSAMEMAVADSLSKVISDNGFDVYESTPVAIKENSPEKLIFNTTLTLFPEINIDRMPSFKVKRQEIKVEEKEIEDTLSLIKSSRAVLKNKDGQANEGDRVEIDFEVRLDGKIIEGGESKNHPLVIGSGNFVPGFEDQIIGMVKEQEKSFSLSAPSDYIHKEIAGKTIDVKIKLNDIKTINYPELNDEFAKSLGQFQSVVALTNSIKDGLIQEKKQKEKERVRLEILNRITGTIKISIPDKMVDGQVNTMITNFDNDLHKNNMELGLYLAKLGKTQDDLKKEWRGEAERQIKSFLVLKQISKRGKISVSKEEIDNNLDALVQSILIRDPGSKVNLDMDKLRNDIITKLINEKVLDQLEKTYT